MRLCITLYFTIWFLNNCINVTVSGHKVCGRSSAYQITRLCAVHQSPITVMYS